MLISKYFRCTHCAALAREFKGLEGGIYIGTPTEMTCPKSKDEEHDFKEIKEPIDQSKASDSPAKR